MLKRPVYLFTAFFVFLGLLVKQLGLYLDDAAYAFPLIDQLYWQHVGNYLKNYSFFRGISLFYYYIIYQLYFKFGLIWLAHLIPIFFFLGIILLLYKILKLQNISEKKILFTVFLIASLPFWTETYSWFSANPALFACFLFFTQVYLIEKHGNSNKIFIMVFLLQFFATFLYETTILMPLSLSFLFLCKTSNKLSWKLGGAYLKKALLLFLPAFFYLFLRIIVPPTVDTRIKFLTIKEIGQNWVDLINSFNYLFSRHSLSNFWLKEIISGANNLSFSPLLLTLFIFIIILFFINIIKKEDRENKEDRNSYNRWLFWLICFLSSIFPLSWQPYYLPFRLLILPFSLLLILFVFLLNSKIKLVIKNLLMIILAFLFPFLLLIQQNLVINYGKQSRADEKIALEIERKIKSLGFDYYKRPYIYIENYPSNNTGAFLYGDYLFSLFHYHWTAKDFFGVRTKIWNDFAIESMDGSYFSSSQTKEIFLKNKSLVILRYNNNYFCSQGDCFALKEVIY